MAEASGNYNSIIYIIDLVVWIELACLKLGIEIDFRSSKKKKNDL